MTIVFAVLVCLAISFSVFWLYSLIADFGTKKLQSYEEWSDKFFNLAARLLDRPDLPKEWIETLSFINSLIDSKSAYVGLARTYGMRPEVTEAKTSLPEEEEAFIEKNPILTREYVSAMRAAFLAMTFLAPVNLGANVRASMAESWERRRPSNSAVKEMEAVSKSPYLKLVPHAA
jgi:hypothetical protein